jgi:hypothetical protein
MMFVKFTGEHIDWVKLKEEYLAKGWKCDKDTAEELWLSFLEDEDHEWLLDYNKDTGSRTMMNGRAVVTLLKAKDERVLCK